MEVLEAILTRRSIRKFTGEVISEENIKTLLKAGFAAPSAHNEQPWHFVVLRETAVLEKIVEFHPHAKMLTKAGCGILVCGDITAQKLRDFLICDCSAAIENILLAANGLGLGAVWCGIFPEETLAPPLKAVLNLPDNIIPVGLIAVGHTEEKKGSWQRYDEEKVHFDKW